MPAVRRSWNASSGWACRFWYVDARLAELSCGWGACGVELMTAAQFSRPAPRHLEWDLTDEVTGRTAGRGERRCRDQRRPLNFVAVNPADVGAVGAVAPRLNSPP